MPKEQKTLNTREMAIIEATADLTASKVVEKLNRLEPEEWVDANTAIAILKCSKVTLWHIQDNPVIKRAKGDGKNGKRMFLRSSLFEYLDSQRTDLDSYKS